MINDLTVGHPLKLIIKFALPLLLGNLFMQLYQVSDMIVVGHLISVNALAAIGASTPIYMVFLTPLLKLMNMPAEIFDLAYDFMYTMTWSTSLIILYNLLSGFIRALGDSKTPLYFLIFSSLVNIVLNFVFIKYFKLGVVGSALGTLVSTALALVICYIYMWKKFPLLRLKKEFMHYDSEMMKAHLRLAFPMALQFSILSVSIMIVQSVCNSFGADVIAAFATAFRIEQFVVQPMLAIGLSMATFTAQNWGANLLSRIRRGVRYAFIITTLMSICGFLLMRQFGQDMIAWFIDTGDTSGGNNTALILEIGKQYLVISTMFYVFFGAIFVFRNTIQGMGKPLLPLVSSFVELLTRVYAAICLAKAIGYEGIMYASPISWAAAGTLVIIGYNYYIHVFKTQTFRWKIGEIKQSLRENGPVD